MIKSGCVSIFPIETHRFFLPQILPHLKKVMPNYTKLWAKIGNHLMNKAKIYRVIPSYGTLISDFPTMKPLSE